MISVLNSWLIDTLPVVAKRCLDDAGEGKHRVEKGRNQISLMGGLQSVWNRIVVVQRRYKSLSLGCKKDNDKTKQDKETGSDAYSVHTLRDGLISVDSLLMDTLPVVA